MSEADDLARATLWWRGVMEDLAAAQDSAQLPRHRCFFAQQAAEKAIKTIFILCRVEFAKSHDIAALIVDLPGAFHIDIVTDEIDHRSKWAVASRYHETLPWPTDTQAQEAAATAEVIVSALRGQATQHGWNLEPGS
jgi:HEPN domain-containing protein